MINIQCHRVNIIWQNHTRRWYHRDAWKSLKIIYPKCVLKPTPRNVKRWSVNDLCTTWKNNVDGHYTSSQDTVYNCIISIQHFFWNICITVYRKNQYNVGLIKKSKIHHCCIQKYSHNGMVWKIHPCNVKELFGKQKQNICFQKFWKVTRNKCILLRIY